MADTSPRGTSCAPRAGRRSSSPPTPSGCRSASRSNGSSRDGAWRTPRASTGAASGRVGRWGPNGSRDASSGCRTWSSPRTTASSIMRGSCSGSSATRRGRCSARVSWPCGPWSSSRSGRTRCSSGSTCTTRNGRSSAMGSVARCCARCGSIPTAACSGCGSRRRTSTRHATNRRLKCRVKPRRRRGRTRDQHPSLQDP